MNNVAEIGVLETIEAYFMHKSPEAIFAATVLFAGILGLNDKACQMAGLFCLFYETS